MSAPATQAATMQAVVQHKYGSADVLQLADYPQPEITDDEVLLRVHAAGLDRDTWHLMTGRPYLGRLAFGVRRPSNPVLGQDVAGTVVSVGSAVTRFSMVTRFSVSAKGPSRSTLRRARTGWRSSRRI